MYDTIAEDIKQAYYLQKYKNDGERFVAWYLRNVYNLDEIQARDCVTDGADDKQIDAIYVDDENSVVYVIQGKYYQGSIDSTPLRETLSSWILLKNPASLQDGANHRLKQKLVEFGAALDDDYEVCFELVTTGELTSAARDDLVEFQKQLVEDDSFSATLVLVDSEEISRRYEIALGKDNPSISHVLQLEEGKFLPLSLGKTSAVIAAVSLRDCLRFPGIKDQTLFRKNVRNSLGSNNKVNKGMRSTIYNEPSEFFFCHNGITAICTSMSLSGNTLTLHGLSVVNGCQSLNTIYSASERVKSADDGYVMIRFYEIPERDRADKISISTNSQSAVKARDLRSNDKRVLLLKKSYEQQYPSGYMVTKRGEEAPADRDDALVVDVTTLGKVFMAWHSQRPNISYSETRVFDKYFDNIFRKDYPAKNVYALNALWRTVQACWAKDAGNPLGLNDSLLAMRAYAPYHHLYAISVFANTLSNMPVENVPDPALVYERLKESGMLDVVVQFAGGCLNIALESAASEPLPNNRVFSPQNWIKTKSCLAGIRAQVKNTVMMMPMMPGGAETKQKLDAALHLAPEDFSERYTAD